MLNQRLAYLFFAMFGRSANEIKIWLEGFHFVQDRLIEILFFGYDREQKLLVVRNERLNFIACKGKKRTSFAFNTIE